MRTRFVSSALCAGVLLLPLSGGPVLAQTTPPAPAAVAPPVVNSAEVAAETAPKTRSLSLAEALALGEKNNRDLQAARARLRGSHADVERALAALMPTVNAQAKFTYNYPEVAFDLSAVFGGSGMAPAGGAMTASGPIAITPQTQLDGLIAANIPLVVPAAYPALKGAKAGYLAQEHKLAVTTAQLLQSVATAFFSAAGSEELVSARRHAIEVSQKTVDIARVRLAAGVVNRVEVSRAELAVIQAEQRVLEAQDTRAAAYRTLGTMLQIDSSSLRVVPEYVSTGEQTEEQKLVDQALRERPELANLTATANAAAAQVKSAWLRWAPTLNGFGNLRLTNATGFGGRADYYALGLQLDWLLFDGFARDAQRHTAEAQKLDAELGLSQMRDTIADEVVNGRRTVLTRQRGLVAAQRSVQLAKDSLDLIRRQYESGTGTQLDLLTAQDQLVVAEVNLAQARFDLALAAINLRRVTGSPLGVTAPAREVSQNSSGAAAPLNTFASARTR